MDASHAVLTAQEVATLRSAIRAGRYLAVPALAVAAPFALQCLEALAPALGVALLAVVVSSPLWVTAMLVASARRDGRERRLAA